MTKRLSRKPLRFLMTAALLTGCHLWLNAQYVHDDGTTCSIMRPTGEDSVRYARLLQSQPKAVSHLRSANVTGTAESPIHNIYFQAECATKNATEAREGCSNSFINCKSFTTSYYICDNPRDTISYCKVSGYSYAGTAIQPVMKECELSELSGGRWNPSLINCNLLNGNLRRFYSADILSSNFVNNWDNFDMTADYCLEYSTLKNCN